MISEGTILGIVSTVVSGIVAIYVAKINSKVRTIDTEVKTINTDVKSINTDVKGLGAEIGKVDNKIEIVATQTDGKITELIEIHKKNSKAEGIQEGIGKGKEEGLILGNLQGKVDILVTGNPTPPSDPTKTVLPEGAVIEGNIEGVVKIKPKE